MTGPESAAASTRRTAVCCGRPMSTIEVSAPLSDPTATLALHTCAACGRHLWERDGEELDRGDVLAVVKDRVAEGPAPRLPRARSSRAPKAATEASPPVPGAARPAHRP